MKNGWHIEHPTFRYDTFECELIQIDGLPYVLEKYQDGEIWSDDEVWGTIIVDLTKKQWLDLSTYIDDVKWWKDNISKENDWWCKLDPEYDTDAYEYYMNEYNTNFKPDKFNSI